MQAEQLIKQQTKKTHVCITDRGNTAIDLALQLLPKDATILIPDQGGWIHFTKGPKKLNLKTQILKTNYGIINPKDCTGAQAILYTAYAGYFAKQDTKAIYKACKNNNITVILDISGAYSDEDLHADIFVASCKKLINHDKGGFIATNQSLPQSIEIKGLKEKLQTAPGRLQELLKKQKQIKEDLKHLKIYHKEKTGTAVAIEYSKEAETYAKEHNLKTIRCPKDIKIKADALILQ